MDAVAEETQEECLGIKDQASGEVRVSLCHCHLLAKCGAESVCEKIYLSVRHYISMLGYNN